ncbi:hypothetical protein BDR07DRAFT_814389 [Suillus spraguei]|nr:hypothetical protein BDR07DRAFT_814389 [Suillus spraguei]
MPDMPKVLQALFFGSNIGFCLLAWDGFLMDRSSFSFQRNGLLTPPSPFPCLYTPTLHLPHFPYLDNRPPLYNCPHNHTSRSCLNDWELEITHVVKLVSICANLSQHVQRKCSGYSC